MSSRWDERYRSGEMADKPPEPLLADAAASTPVGEALDVACGIGRHSIWLARHDWRVTAVDSSKIALRLLEENAAGLPIRIVRADLEEGEFQIEPERYSLIVDTCFLHRPLFTAMREGICPGGVFFGVFPLKGDEPSQRPFNPSFLIEPGELREYFADWELLHYSEGRPAPGRRLRASVIARRPPSSQRQELR